MIKRIGKFVALCSMLVSLYMISTVGVVRPIHKPLVSPKPTALMVKKPHSVVKSHRSYSRSKTAQALIICFSDCVKNIIFALVVSGKASEFFAYVTSFSFSRRQSSKRLSKCTDKRWLNRVKKIYPQWLVANASILSVGHSSTAVSKRKRGDLLADRAKGLSWYAEDIDIHSVGIVQSGSNKTVLSVSAYMRHYALDKEGFIAVGSKDFVAKEMYLSFVKRQKQWVLVDVGAST